MGKSRHKAEVERDRRKIARLYLQGSTQSDIAEELKISQSTVSRDLTVIQKQWAEARISDIDERKRIELAKIDNLELIYWEGWKRSCEKAEIETTKMTGNLKKNQKEGEGDKPDRMEKTKRIENMIGDPRFLQGIERCIYKRCELLGLNAPIKSEVNINALTDRERITKLTEILDTARARADGRIAQLN